MTQDITSLIEKLEGAEVGSRELDGLMAANLRDLSGEYAKQRWAREWGGPFACEGGTVFLMHTDPIARGPNFQAPAYTTSLDAALALAERVVGEEAALSLLQDTIEGWNAASGLSVKNLPRLFCAAILRAQSEAR